MLNIYYIWCITIISIWFEVTESVTLPWKSTLIISILTFPSINCMQCFDKIPIIGGELSKTFVKPRASTVLKITGGHIYNGNIAFRCSTDKTVWIGYNCLSLMHFFPHSLLQSTTDSIHWPLSMWGCKVVPHYSFLEFSFQQWNSCHHKSIFKLWWRAVTPDRNLLNWIR